MYTHRERHQHDSIRGTFCVSRTKEPRAEHQRDCEVHRARPQDGSKTSRKTARGSAELWPATTAVDCH